MNRAALAALLLAAACSGASTPAAAPGPTVIATPSPTAPAAITTTPTPVTTPAGPTGPVGTAVPPGFVPGSVTFISERTGWVLGQAPCSGAGRCDAIVRTRDGGRTWRAIPAPATGPDQLAQVRFANERDGFVTGTRLWATHDGGGTWKPVSGHRDVTALETAAGRVWLVQDGLLLSGPAAGSTFATERTPGPVSSVVVHGTTAYAAALPSSPPRLYVGKHASGLPAMTLPCASDDVAADVGVQTRQQLLLLCLGDAGAGSQGRSAWLTSDGGGHWTAAHEPAQTQGLGVALTTSAGFLLDRFGIEVTRDGGRTWSSCLNSDGALAQGGFVSDALGVVVGGTSSGAGGVLRVTRDQGRTWTATKF